MTRLTNAIKDQIVENAIKKAGISEKQNEVIQRRANWANQCRLQAIGGEVIERQMISLEKRLIKQLDKFPESVRKDFSFKRDSDILLNVAGCNAGYVYFNGKIKRWSAPKEHIRLITPYEHTIKAGDPLADEFHAIETAIREINDEVQTLRENLRGTLSGFTTIKKLLEAWPEAKELIPTAIERPASTLPAVQTEKLNSMIGLPTDIQEAA